MLLYFAGYSTDKEIYEVEGAENFLESYLLFKNKDYKQFHIERKLLGKRLFLDSGAFSAFTRGIQINIDEYADFLKKNEQYITTYATLDVIGDYKGTQRNTKYLESKGLHPLPTFHYGSPYEVLEQMVNEYEGGYIALGGLVPLSTDRKTMQAHLDKCFSIIKTRCKVHAFGVNGVWAWLRYPFYSADATSWLMGGKFRHAVVWNSKKMKMEQVTKRTKVPSKLSMLTYDGHYADINKHNAAEYVKAANFATKLWEARGVKWEYPPIKEMNILYK